MLRRLIVLSAALLMVFASAAHAQYVPGQPGFILDPNQVLEGGATTTASGVGCPPSTNVVFTIDGVQVGTTVSRPDPDGSFDATLSIPASFAPGEYTVVATCGNVRMTNTLTITAVPTSEPTSATTLPRTGSDSMLLVRIGLALAATGGLLVLGTQKRRARV